MNQNLYFLKQGFLENIWYIIPIGVMNAPFILRKVMDNLSTIKIVIGR